MKLGFIGTGVITEAIVVGLMEAEFPLSEIVVSARGAATAARLAAFRKGARGRASAPKDAVSRRRRNGSARSN